MRRRGATLIEVLIAIGVSTMLTSLVIVYGSGGRENTALYVDSVKLAQTILRAKSQSVLIYYNPANPVCGYGIRIFSGNAPAYELFRYAVLEGESCTDLPPVETADTAHYVRLQRVPLAAGVSFGTGTTIDTILFVPPDPLTILWNQDARVRQSGVVELMIGDGTNRRPVTITTSGQISY